MKRYLLAVLVFAAACGSTRVDLGGQRRSSTRDPSTDDDNGGDTGGRDGDGPGADEPDYSDLCDEPRDWICDTDGEWHRCHDLDDDDRDWVPMRDQHDCPEP